MEENTMNDKKIQIKDLEVTSLDQLIDLYNQGYRLSQEPTFDSSGNVTLKMSNGTGIILSLTVVGILWFMFWAFIIYIVGKAEASLIGLG